MSLQPIASNPDYAACISEIEGLNVALSKVRGRLQEISVLRSTPEPSKADAERVSAAMEFVASGRVRVGTVADGLADEQRILREQETALVQAVAARGLTRDAVASGLSAELSRKIAPKHKALAKEYLGLLERLDELMEQESQLLREASAAGYELRFAESLFDPVMGRIADSTGSRLYYRARDLRRYLG